MNLSPPTASGRDAAPPALRTSWFQTLALNLILLAASWAIPQWISYNFVSNRMSAWLLEHDMWEWFYDFVFLAFALLLCLPTPLRCGMRIGRIRQHWWRTLLVMAVPIVLSAIISPRLPQNPFRGMGASMWAVSPLAQDLLISGYIYASFEPLAPRRIVRRLPINGAVLLTALFFSLWHLPNFLGWTSSFVTFQLVYVFVGCVWVGMTRVWTGSMLYITIVHMAVNAIALYSS